MEALESRDVPAVVTIEAVQNAAEGGANGIFRLTRTGDTSGELTVSYRLEWFGIESPATPGADFSISGLGRRGTGSVRFAADSATADVVVTAVDDIERDPAETVALDLIHPFGGGYTVGTPSFAQITIIDNELAPTRWLGVVPQDWSDASNWTDGAPTAGSAVYFDGNYSSADATIPAGATFAEVHIVNGYTGRVTLAGTLSVGKLELASADAKLDQPSAGTDLTITNQFVWTAGTLNSTAHVATVTLTGATTTALLAPTGGGEVNLGSNFEIENGAVATQSEGTISVADGVRIAVRSLGKWAVDPGALKVVTVNVNLDPAVVKQIDIGPGGVLQVLSGTLNSKLAIVNAGGSFVLDAGTCVNASGATPGPLGPDSRGFVQTAGVTYIAVDAQLTVTGLGLGADLSGGILSIKCGTRPATYDGYNIVGNLYLKGASIEYDAAGGARSEFGTFMVNGNVIWSAGTYHYYVDASASDSDVWYVTGDLDIRGTAAVVATAIDSQDGDRVVVPPRSTWEMLRAEKIRAANNTPGLPAGWKFAKDPERPDEIWRAEYTG